MKPPTQQSASPASDETPRSALECALALVDRGSQHDGGSTEWIAAAWRMSDHCVGREDVTEAAARILAAEYRKALAALESIEGIYTDGCDTYEDWKAMGELARGYFLAHSKETPTSEDSSAVDAGRASEPELATAPCSAWHRTADKYPPPLTAVEITHPNFIGTRIGMLYPHSMRLHLTDCTHPLQNSYVPIEGSAWRLLPNAESTHTEKKRDET